MIDISEEYVGSLAANAGAISNARSIARSNKIMNAAISCDQTYIQCECAGSGKSNYISSADFINPGKPVLRCSCPSRQIPCKHTLGLLYHYIYSGSKFKRIDMPEDILAKREKLARREEKKDTADDKPKKVNKSALVKKINARIDGLRILEKLIVDIVSGGLAMISSKTIDMINEKIKELGNYYLSGPQIRLKYFVSLFEENENHEKIYTKAMDIITGLHSFVKKAGEYLESRAKDPELKMDDKSVMEEWLGHAWQLDELKSYGLLKNNAELVQLSFNSYTDNGRDEEVDEGFWIDLSNGEILTTYNYRPFRAKKYIKEEDSFFDVAVVRELYRYPGETNPRVRWNEYSTRQLTGTDLDTVKGYAYRDFTAVIKNVKNIIKNPLNGKTPVFLLGYDDIVKINDEYAMFDDDGTMLVFDASEEYADKPLLLNFMNRDLLSDKSMLAMFTMNTETLNLRIVPLSIITGNGIIRFFY